jgi:ribosomal protein S18 acetylase RimI-like enzyme
MMVLKIEAFLRAVDNSFPIPLSQKQDLGEYAQKLSQFATLCAVEEDGKIVAMAAGYTDRDPAYLAILATLPQVRGRGLGKALVREFMEKARQSGASYLHLYAVESNTPAMKLYESLGFTRWDMPNEPRKEDVHFIYFFR